jgi:hypothetical protein
MFGKNPRIKALQSRKQLLIAESELNRAHFLQEWEAMAGDVRVAARQAKIIGSLAAAAGLLAAGFSSFRRKQAAPSDEKPSWWRNIVKYAGVATSLWSAFRPREHAEKDN